MLFDPSYAIMSTVKMPSYSIGKLVSLPLFELIKLMTPGRKTSFNKA